MLTDPTNSYVRRLEALRRIPGSTTYAAATVEPGGARGGTRPVTWTTLRAAECRRVAATLARLGDLRHPALAEVLMSWVDEAAGEAHMVCEHGELGTLRDVLRAKDPRANDEAWRRSAAAQLASGLAFMHAGGVMHRDLCPSSVAVTRDGVKICEYACAAAGAGTGRSAATALGELAYAAPEMMSGEGYDEAVDVYALGVLLVELWTGGQPAYATMASNRRLMVESKAAGGAPPGLARVEDERVRAILARCLAADPELRPTAEELTEQLVGL